MVTEYLLIRSKRKTIGIYIRDDKVEVRAPLGTKKKYIDEFVASKENWISEHLTQSKIRAEQKKDFELNYGDTVVLLGKNYPIREKPGNKLHYDGESFLIPPGLEPIDVKYACVQLYRHIAKSHLTARVAFYAEKMNLKPVAVKINGAKTRWGSCSSNGNINFSWRLIMAEGEVIDYVVVHELAHMLEMNHSEQFWAVVESVIPNYQKRKARLKELQIRLATENWED